MYNLLIYSKNEVVFLEHIKEIEVLKALKLFAARNDSWRCVLYEYSHLADDEDKYFEVLRFWY